MKGLFTPEMTELSRINLDKPDEAVELVKWLTGNVGIARGLRDGKLVTVPAGSVNTNPTDAQVRHAIQGVALSLFCTCFSDDEAVKKFQQAKLLVPKMRKIVTDNGLATMTTPIVRLIDHARHLPFNMKISARLCGPCEDDFRHMSDWQYDGRVTECDDHNKFLVFGAPFAVPGSIERTVVEQRLLLNYMSKNFGLPYLSHVSAALGALVALSHLHETGGEVNGQRLPAKNMSVRTGTKFGTKPDGCLYLMWDANGSLCCDRSNWSDNAINCVGIGCFALAVVKLDK